jgi:hypothetical protein
VPVDLLIGKKVMMKMITLKVSSLKKKPRKIKRVLHLWLRIRKN